MVQDTPPRHVLTVYEVRDQYGIPISTQRQWRAQGRFVPFFRAGARIVYRRELIERWIEEQEELEQATRAVAMADKRIDDEKSAANRHPAHELADQVFPPTPQDLLISPAIAGSRPGCDGA